MDQKLDKLNELEVIEYSSCAGELEYVLVENTPFNRAKLSDLGATTEDLEDVECSDESELDISVLAFRKLDAKWFEPGEGFK